MKRRHQEEKIPGILCFISIKTGPLLVTIVIKSPFDRTGFWIPCCGFWIPVLFSGTWTTDSNRQGYSGFLELYSGFQSPGFQIQQEKISQIPLHGANLKRPNSFVVEYMSQVTTVACHKLVNLVADLRRDSLFRKRNSCQSNGR